MCSQKHRGEASPRGVEVVKVKSAFSRCCLGCDLGWTSVCGCILVRLLRQKGESKLSFIEASKHFSLVSELVFILRVTLDAVRLAPGDGSL